MRDDFVEIQREQVIHISRKYTGQKSSVTSNSWWEGVKVKRMGAV